MFSQGNNSSGGGENKIEIPTQARHCKESAPALRPDSSKVARAASQIVVPWLVHSLDPGKITLNPIDVKQARKARRCDSYLQI